MIFSDKNFYLINNKYNVALQDTLEENKEIAIIYKEEQSLIKVNINENSNFIENKNYSFNNNNNFCKNCLKGLEEQNNKNELLNKQNTNIKLDNNESEKINKEKKRMIKELPKNFVII